MTDCVHFNERTCLKERMELVTEIQRLKAEVESLRRQLPNKTTVDLIVRDIGETDGFNPDHEDAICISYQRLTLILQNHLSSATPTEDDK